MLFIWTLYSQNPEKMYDDFHKILGSTTIFNINNKNNKNKLFLSSKSAYNQHRMISEGSCDTEVLE